MYKVKSPVLLIIFNRLDTTKKVFAEIKKNKPAKLFIASDGPRIHKEGESEIVNNIRNYVLNEIDWDCEVKTLFRDTNLGCGVGVSTAITWFFNNVEQGIILEDDCLPLPGFFQFCDELLNYYENKEHIYSITGSNLQGGKIRGDGSYYFSNYGGIWGWATWARTWKNYDYRMDNLDYFLSKKKLDVIFSDKKQQIYWSETLSNAKDIDTWDYQWLQTSWSHNGICIVPNANLTKNIGFNNQGTHTNYKPKWYDKLAIGNGLIDYNMIHPKSIKVNVKADNFLFNNCYMPRSFYSRMYSLLNKIKIKLLKKEKTQRL